MIITFKHGNPKQNTSYMGRNGIGKQIGIEILPVGPPAPEQIITLSPVNSKGNIANCSIDIPVADIPEFVEQLHNAYKQATRIQSQK